MSDCWNCQRAAHWRLLVRMLTGLWYPTTLLSCDACRRPYTRHRADREIRWKSIDGPPPPPLNTFIQKGTG